jgi:5-methyltetrahydrofolate--homocysteine methyltransferase
MEGNRMDEKLQEIYTSILEGTNQNIGAQVQTALDAGIGPSQILNDGMVAAMAEVGRLFEEGEFFVPEMLISARAMKTGMEVLKPHLAQAEVRSAGKVVIGTVQGDLHDIGKNLVAMMLEGAAFEIIDLGADVSPERFVETVRESGAQVVAMSALLTTTMGSMRVTIDALKAAGLRDQVRVIVGGAPLSAKYAQEIGADGFAMDASQAVQEARKLVG